MKGGNTVEGNGGNACCIGGSTEKGNAGFGVLCGGNSVYGSGGSSCFRSGRSGKRRRSICPFVLTGVKKSKKR